MDGGLQPPGEIGELQLRGAALMTGYWNQPQWQTEKTSPATDGGRPWYRTGDLVVSLPSGELQYAGRIGRMIKLRGYRVEPAEIEARLYQHSAIYEVGVVPVERPGGLQLVAHVSTLSGERLSMVELKEFCALKLPPYMIPEQFEFHVSLPRTSRGKIDLHGLAARDSAVRT